MIQHTCFVFSKQVDWSEIVTIAPQASFVAYEIKDSPLKFLCLFNHMPLSRYRRFGMSMDVRLRSDDPVVKQLSRKFSKLGHKLRLSELVEFAGKLETTVALSGMLKQKVLLLDSTEVWTDSACLAENGVLKSFGIGRIGNQDVVQNYDLQIWFGQQTLNYAIDGLVEKADLKAIQNSMGESKRISSALGRKLQQVHGWLNELWPKSFGNLRELRNLEEIDIEAREIARYESSRKKFTLSEPVPKSNAMKTGAIVKKSRAKAKLAATTVPVVAVRVKSQNRVATKSNSIALGQSVFELANQSVCGWSSTGRYLAVKKLIESKHAFFGHMRSTTIDVLDIQTGQELFSIEPTRESIPSAIAWSPDDGRLVVLCQSSALIGGSPHFACEVQWWNVASGKMVKKMLMPMRVAIRETGTFSWSPCGHRLAIGSHLGMWIINAVSGELESTFATRLHLHSYCWSPDGNFLMGYAPNWLYALSVPSGRSRWKLRTNISSIPWMGAMAVSPCCNYFVISDRRSIRIGLVESGKKLAQISVDGWPTSYSSCGKYLSGCTGESSQIWRLDSLKSVCTIGSRNSSVQFSQVGKQVLMIEGDSEAKQISIYQFDG